LITRLHPRSVSHGRVGAGSYERSICIRRSAANGISIRTRGAAGVYDAAAAGRRVARAGGWKSASSSPHLSPAPPASSRRHHHPEHKEGACMPTLRSYPCMSRLGMCGMATQRKNQGRNAGAGARARWQAGGLQSVRRRSDTHTLDVRCHLTDREHIHSPSVLEH